MKRKLKQRVFDVIQPAADRRLVSRIFDLFIITLIAASVASVFMLTFELSDATRQTLHSLEKISIAIFSAEYLLRIWTADLLYPELPALRARLKYLFSPLALIDLAAILPFYLPMIMPLDLVGLRAVRLARVLRLFKLNRYSEALKSIGEVFRSKGREIVISIFLVFILLVIASLMIYYAEHDAQPKAFPNAFSGLWWAVATLTTVGYGDIYPITVWGRVLGAGIAIMGIGMIAVPTGILSSGFVELLEKKVSSGGDEPPKYCPHCGKKLPEVKGK